MRYLLLFLLIFFPVFAFYLPLKAQAILIDEKIEKAKRCEAPQYFLSLKDLSLNVLAITGLDVYKGEIKRVGRKSKLPHGEGSLIIVNANKQYKYQAKWHEGSPKVFMIEVDDRIYLTNGINIVLYPTSEKNRGDFMVGLPVSEKENKENKVAYSFMDMHGLIWTKSWWPMNRDEAISYCSHLKTQYNKNCSLPSRLNFNENFSHEDKGLYRDLLGLNNQGFWTIESSDYQFNGSKGGFVDSEDLNPAQLKRASVLCICPA